MVKGTVIVDNGAHSIKAEYSKAAKPRIFPNAVIKAKNDRKRVYVADELEECQDRCSLFFLNPFERGYLVNWDTQLQVWDRIFGKETLDVDFQNSRLVLTDPSDLAKAMNDVSHEVIFETYQFDSFLRTSASSCVAQANYMSDISQPHNENSRSCCSLIVDSSHSFTHVVPYVEGRIVRSGIVRVEIGGKAITNQLKEWISFRHMNVLEETYMINQCKEDVCFVTTDLQRDINMCQQKGLGDLSLKRDYILPDFVEDMRGKVRIPSLKPLEDRSKICLGVERFAAPEILFHPTDIGLNQMGVVEAISYSLNKLPEEVRFEMMKNIVLVGGNTLFKNFKERVELDLRPLLDEMFDFKVSRPEDPITYAWRCAAELIENEAASSFRSRFVSRSEFHESGPNICRERFGNFFDEKFC